MDAVTTYLVRGKKQGFVWEFQYDLNGFLRGFKILEGNLTGNQMKWLFSGSNFPASETLIKTIWLNNKEISRHIEVTVGEPDLSFVVFWQLYDEKQKKQVSLKLWNKLTKADKLNAIKYIRSYNSLLRTKNQAKALPDTYLRQKRWLDDK